MNDKLYQDSLKYHAFPNPGKLSIAPTKPMSTQADLALAYSPGVAAACLEIVNNPAQARNLTSRRNLAAVISNGSAVLGLGNIGALASKPVMEGKAVLFKKFANIDCFDIEVNESNPDKFIDVVAALEPTFGAINLEDIKAPECFYIEEELKKRLKIPVFHDDQHGTAIITAAAVKNALELVQKNIAHVRIVVSGAGAAAIACLNLLVYLGLKRENVIMCDKSGVVRADAANLAPHKAAYATSRDINDLQSALIDADIFLGLSGPNVLTGEMIKPMAKDPIILAMANPIPEILPEVAKESRPDAIVATGRSDYPNQVNNVLCFPFIFRGALDVGATQINEAMKVACVDAIANLAKVEASDVVVDAYGGVDLKFGRDYIIPKPFDPRLMLVVAPAVAKAAMDSGVALHPIEDFAQYRLQLQGLVSRSKMIMGPVLAKARTNPQRIAFSEGEKTRVLHAVQSLVDEGYAKPIVIGRREVVTMRIQKLNLRLKIDEDFELVDPQSDPRFREYWQAYHHIMKRKGVMPDIAKTVVRTNTTVIGCLMVQRGEADGLIIGPSGLYRPHLIHVINILGKAPHTEAIASLNILMTNKGPLFICDAFVNPDPSAEEIANIALLACEHVSHFGLEPRIALVSHSNFGSSRQECAIKMRNALEKIRQQRPDLAIDGEMQVEAALDESIRAWLMPETTLAGAANVLVCPNIDAANIAYNLAKCVAGIEGVGPVLLGVSKPVHIMTAAAKVRDILNLTAFAVVEAQLSKEKIA